MGIPDPWLSPHTPASMANLTLPPSVPYTHAHPDTPVCCHVVWTG